MSPGTWRLIRMMLAMMMTVSRAPWSGVLRSYAGGSGGLDPPSRMRTSPSSPRTRSSRRWTSGLPVSGAMAWCQNWCLWYVVFVQTSENGGESSSWIVQTECWRRRRFSKCWLSYFRGRSDIVIIKPDLIRLTMQMLISERMGRLLLTWFLLHLIK